MFSWMGTRNGPERKIVESYGMVFFGINSGRLRRYFDVRNVGAPFETLLGYGEAVRVLRALRPAAVVSAGAYVSVPAFYAARRLGIPTILYEMDVRRGLANKLMGPVTSHRVSLLPKVGVETVGAFVRPSVLKGEAEVARTTYGLPADVPVILVTGGGTGALGLNRLVYDNLDAFIERAVVVHLTGPGKKGLLPASAHYVPLEFVGDDMAHLLAVATLVVSRAGMGSISELAALKKASVLVPMPDSHQMENAMYVSERGAAVLFDQRRPLHEFGEVVLELLENESRRQAMSSILHDLIPNGTPTFLSLVDGYLKT